MRVSDAEDLIRLVVDRVQGQINAQLAADDAVDLKALGVLAADAAAVGVLVASRPSLNPFWWAPMVVLALAGLVLLFVVYPVELETGPRWTQWYATFGGSAFADAGRQMLVDLTDVLEKNKRVTRRNGIVFKAGFVTMLVGLIGCVIVGLDRP
ncbi:MAG TPA: hypothetical protein VGL76_07755 [Gaiellaceae bacterium]